MGEETSDMTDTAYTPIPRLERHGDDVLLMVDGAPFTMLAGEVHNSCSSSSRAFAQALDQAVSLGMNSVLTPVTWELVEPEEGHFDFSCVDSMLELARQRGLRLGLLWFGAWKNAQAFYAPGWVKRDLERFPRAQMVAGQNRVVLTDFHNMTYTALSLFGDETRAADARAFAALMAHLAEVDTCRTVITVQVENECGEQGAAREHSAAADAAFAQMVPADLVEALRASAETLAPDIAQALAVGTGEGTWEEVFGPVAEEIFTTYHMAGYVEAVARAGRDAYQLPLAVNCWLDKGRKPGRFPTGGPVARVMEVWRHVAPSIEVICPDVYVPYFCQVCDEYRKLGNPLYVPETAVQAYAAPREIWAVGHHHAVCFAPFGFEDMGTPFDASAGVLFGADTSDPMLRTPQEPEEYARTTRAVAQLLELLPTPEERATLDAVTSERPDENVIDLVDFRLTAHFPEGGMPGAVAAGRARDGSIYVVSSHAMITFSSTAEDLPHVDFIALEDGSAQDGAWVRDRRLNGDEATVTSYDEPTLLRVELFAYA